MRYFVMEIETTESGTAKQITEKTTIDEAKALYHQILASVYANKDITYALVMVVNDKGFSEMMDRYPTAQPEEPKTIVSIDVDGNTYTIRYSDGTVEVFEKTEETYEGGLTNE